MGVFRGWFQRVEVRLMINTPGWSRHLEWRVHHNSTVAVYQSAVQIKL